MIFEVRAVRSGVRARCTRRGRAGNEGSARSSMCRRARHDVREGGLLSPLSFVRSEARSCWRTQPPGNRSARSSRIDGPVAGHRLDGEHVRGSTVFKDVVDCTLSRARHHGGGGAEAEHHARQSRNLSGELQRPPIYRIWLRDPRAAGRDRQLPPASAWRGAERALQAPRRRAVARSRKRSNQRDVYFGKETALWADRASMTRCAAARRRTEGARVIEGDELTTLVLPEQTAELTATGQDRRASGKTAQAREAA